VAVGGAGRVPLVVTDTVLGVGARSTVLLGEAHRDACSVHAEKS
jgi:hypothetical protein